MLIRPDEQAAEVAGHIADVDDIVLVGIVGVDCALHAALGGVRAVGLNIEAVADCEVGDIAHRCLIKNIPTSEL